MRSIVVGEFGAPQVMQVEQLPDDEVKRVLWSGTVPDGHVVPYRTMPWGNFSHLTEEDRHAIVVYLRSLPPVTHQIPEPSFEPVAVPPGAVEGISGLKDSGIN